MWALYSLSSDSEILELLRAEDFPLKSMFKMTVRVSFISGSKSPQPLKNNNGIRTSISRSNSSLNTTLFIKFNLILIKNTLFKKGKIVIKNI